MSSTSFKIATIILMAAPGIWLADAASAAPSGASSPEETIEELRAQRYRVQVNGLRNGPMSNCTVDAVRGPFENTPGATVYVDLNCVAEYLD